MSESATSTVPASASRQRADGRRSRTLIVWQHGRGVRTLVVPAGREVADTEHDELTQSAGAAGPTSAEIRRFVQRVAKRSGARHVVAIAPASACVARVAALPSGADAAAQRSALALLAEGQLPARIAAHRRALGVVPGPVGAVGLMTGWLAGRSGAMELADDGSWHWIAEQACVAAVAAGAGAGAVAVSDGALGALVAAAVGSRGLAVRSSVRPESAQADTRTERARAGAELAYAACAQAGADATAGDEAARVIVSWFESRDGTTARDGEVLVLASAVRGPMAEAISRLRNASVAGAGTRAGASRSMKLTLGACAAIALALEARGADGHSGAGLAAMTSVERSREPGFGGWAARRWRGVQSPRTCGTLVAAGLGLAVLGPMGLAHVRHGIAQGRLDAIAQPGEDAADLATRSAMYEQLLQDRWPMTRLLAVLARSAPQGVELTSIRFARDSGVRVEGSGSSADVVGEFVANLNRSRLFERARSGKVERAGATGVVFELSASVARTSGVSEPADLPDFAAEPLAVRLYGEAARGTIASGASGTSDGSARPRSATSGTVGSGSAERSGERATRGGGPIAAATGEDDGGIGRGVTDRAAERPERGGEVVPTAPPPLTDEQIAAMDRGKAMKEWSERRRATQRDAASLDAPTMERLKAEIDKLKARMDATAQGG